MVTVSLAEDNKTLILKAHYFYSDRLKKLPGAMFEPISKTWRVDKQWIDEVDFFFDGEIYYKTPLWVIKNEPAPDMSKMYQLKRDLALPVMKLEPFDYQKYGIRFMLNCLIDNKFVINADDVGLGKTPQAIGSIKYVIDYFGYKKILILAKKSIKSQWKKEIAKFTDIDKTYTIEYTLDAKKKRDQSYEAIKNCSQGILITSYHNYLNDAVTIGKIDFDLVIIDEAHCVATRTGKIHKNIAYVTCGKPTIFLTGTPVMSKPEDLFGIAQLANPKYFGPWKAFHERYIVDQDCGSYTQTIGAKNLNELREKTQAILIRRTEYEVSVQLPEVLLNRIDCELDPVQAKLIEEINKQRDALTLIYNDAKMSFDKTKNPKFLDEMNKADAQSKGLIAATQAAASDPRMFLMTKSKMMKKLFGDLIPKGYAMSSKTEITLDHVEEIVNLGEKVIIFSKFKTSVDLLASDIAAKLKIKTLSYTGDEDDQQREFVIDKFWNDDTYNVVLATHAFAEGVNAQVAKFMINYDQPDTLAIKTQRIGRIRRVGSNHGQVVVYDMITEGSKDVERLENIEKNANLEGALVNIDQSQREALINAMKQ